MCEKLPTLAPGAKICDDCRKKVAMMPTLEAEFEPPLESGEEACASSYSLCEDVNCPLEPLESVNQCLTELGETPIVKKLQQV